MWAPGFGGGIYTVYMTYVAHLHTMYFEVASIYQGLDLEGDGFRFGGFRV